jgi:transcriptional regulator with XRE-family HTH domain
MSEKLGRRIATLRAERRWTQQQLAERLGVSRVAVSHLESNLNDPGERTVALLAGLVHMEPHELVAGTTYPAAKMERLPLVVARWTEVEHRLALLDADLRWVGRLPAAEVRRLLEGWLPTLDSLRTHAADPAERAALDTARRKVSDQLAGARERTS